MKLNQLRTDGRAVSPVVGVVLMISIAVVLASVVGGVVLGLGTEPATAPSASFDFQSTSTGIEAMHAGGNAIDTDEIVIQLDSSTTTKNAPSVGDEWTTGESATLTGGAASAGDVVRIVWEAPNSDKSALLASFEA